MLRLNRIVRMVTLTDINKRANAQKEVKATAQVEVKDLKRNSIIRILDKEKLEYNYDEFEKYSKKELIIIAQKLLKGYWEFKSKEIEICEKHNCKKVMGLYWDEDKNTPKYLMCVKCNEESELEEQQHQQENNDIWSKNNQLDDESRKHWDSQVELDKKDYEEQQEEQELISEEIFRTMNKNVSKYKHYLNLTIDNFVFFKPYHSDEVCPCCECSPGIFLTYQDNGKDYICQMCFKHLRKRFNK